MSEENKHKGGCSCGKNRYETSGNPERARVCHCRYCQLRTGSPFGIGAWFKEENVKHISKNYNQYKFTTESGNKFETNFCKDCGTSVYWTISGSALKGLVAIGVGTFDPPSFWFDISGEIFTRSKASYINIDGADHFETSPAYKPAKSDDERLDGSK